MKKQGIFLMTVMFFAASFLAAQPLPSPQLYGTGTWDSDSLGNHRAVVRVEKPNDAVWADIPWRRRDVDPENKDIIVIDAKTGQRITNVYRVLSNREKAEIIFQPATAPGDYYIYYLKSIQQGSPNYPKVTYPEFQETADENWVKKHKLQKARPAAFPHAQLVQFQAIDEFNSFYPMEVIATAKETEQVVRDNSNAPFVLFPEDRKYPIRMTGFIPYRWANHWNYGHFQGKAGRGEYYTFQVGVWADKSAIDIARVEFSGLVNAKSGERIPTSAFTCFNTEGNDAAGMHFTRSVHVPKGQIQPLWIGFQIPKNLSAGSYQGTVNIVSGQSSRPVKVDIEVQDQETTAHGDNEPWKHSRLRWLNSKIAQDDDVIAPYTPLVLEGNSIKCLGRKVTIAKSGFPQEISCFYNESVTKMTATPKEVLAKPVGLVVKHSGNEPPWENLYFSFTKVTTGTIGWKSVNQNPWMVMECEGTMQFDGNITFNVTVMAREQIDLDDIYLNVPMNAASSKYLMGLGEKGGLRKNDIHWKWDIKKNQDGVWLGDVNAGLQSRFFAENYERPLNTNFYQKKPLKMPPSWYNDNKGGIDILDGQDGTVLVKAYSGERAMAKGESLHYDFNFAVTPFHPINTAKHWHNRYYHQYAFLDSIQAYGANVINVHQGTKINPYINYPYLTPGLMKAYVDGAHARGMKVKIYNTVRELSNYTPEIFALKSLGDEIFSHGQGGGYSWLQEHLEQDYITGWLTPKVKDAAIITNGISRWHNYYLEGLKWLVDNIGIDGLYIDDLAFNRETMQRVRKVLLRSNSEALIDLHSANQYNPRDGFANSANLYMEDFPYLDRLWFGEYFDYDMPPDFWMTEMSGVPFGLMGEMLWKGGNPWRGMLWGMTVRAPWSGDPKPIWEEWDKFGIGDSEMIGYWDPANPVHTDNDSILATVYKKSNKILIALASWAPKDAPVHLTIDWKAIGLDPAKHRLKAPKIQDFQEEKSWAPGDAITVPKGKGYLIVVE